MTQISYQVNLVTMKASKVSAKKAVNLEIPRKKLKMDLDGSAVIASSEESEAESEQDTSYPTMTQVLIENQDMEAEEMVNQSEPEMEEESQVEIPMDSFMGHLELYWNHTFLNKVISILKMCEKKSVELANLESKRFFCQAVMKWNQLLEHVLHGKDNKKLLKKCSWMVFVNRASGAKSFTTFCSQMLTKQQADIFNESVNKVLKELSSSSPLTTTTTTSSTIVHTPVQPVDVPVLPKSDEDEDVLEKVFGLGSSTSNTGVISQNIYSTRNGKLFSLKSPGETGYMIVKLETYLFQKVCHLDKKNWWKEADIRSQFIVSSIADPKYEMVRKLVAKSVKDVCEIKGIEKNEKPIGSSGFYKH